jgi:hypothetical protein
VYAVLLTVSKVVLDRKLELSAQFGNGLAMKADDVANAENASRKNVVTLVVLDPRGIALVGHGIHRWMISQNDITQRVSAAGWASLIGLLVANNRLNAAYLLKESFGRL